MTSEPTSEELGETRESILRDVHELIRCENVKELKETGRVKWVVIKQGANSEPLIYEKSPIYDKLIEPHPEEADT